MMVISMVIQDGDQWSIKYVLVLFSPLVVFVSITYCISWLQECVQELFVSGICTTCNLVNDRTWCTVQLYVFHPPQVVELIAGIGWGTPNARKIIYWGMLGGDIMLVAVYAAFVHSMSEWHAVNIATVTLASVFGLLRIITLVLNPRWWCWGEEWQNGLP